ncbi:fumarylacetoacetate hydrolase family protein [Rhodoplanes sp. Z2-YC6860]|uniref:fumarylacetoacetate hydrolase family protein n=1 Tax=Rhodoplanes sp. Z2-YC6860 TaxID=674703 RepID=UPI00078DC10F|nr:fumarylacetoacetate hydrolase family protein [Rhodoplanes sp. Z2-YC6860]AMN44425.1 2-hydroxyhepta-2,4-diene-1,7-dioate isomerase [Rhodoplanes sp. Z2-YC6860]
MNLATYNIRGRSSFGVAVGDGIVDLRPRLAPRLTSVLDVLRAGALDQVRSVVAGVRPDFPLSEVEMLPPIPGCEKILCIGVNYAKRDTELEATSGNADAKYPSMFFKPPNSFVAHNAPILRPPESEQLEYEGEIALVIGKTGRRIPRDQALDWVAGITLCNEGTIRDWIRHGRFNVTQGKAWDSTGSMGPWVATGVDLSKPLHIICKINGEVTQNDTTDSMIFKFADILSYASTFMTLKPGDIICTGTPIKLNQKDGERKWLKAGDVFEMTVPEVGTLRNVVEDEK